MPLVFRSAIVLALGLILAMPQWASAANLMAAQGNGSQPAPAYGAPVEVTGELDVIIKEDFDRGRFEHDYFLRDDNGTDWYQLEFARTPPGQLRSGQRMRMRGTPNGRKFRVESFDEQGSVAPGGSLTTGDQAVMETGAIVDERKAVVMIVKLNNASAGQSYSQIVGNMYTNTRSVDGLYREASLGQTSFPPDTDGNGQPDVFGPFDIGNNYSTCDYYGWAYAAESAAQAAGVNLSLYRHRVFVLPPKSSLPSCSWSGIANVGCGTFCRAWIAGSTGMIFTHELGHNLNMAHAGTDPENDGTINSVYGDYSDPMGSSSSSWYLFNAAHLDQLGWYAGTPGAVTSVLASGTYEVAAIGADPWTSGAPAGLKIHKPDTGDHYYVSYRQPIGTYNQLSTTYTRGVNIHRYIGSGYGYTSFIQSLTDGAAFSDSPNGITIRQVATAGDYATVQVSFEEVGFGCTAAIPSVAGSPASVTLKPGSAAAFSVTVTNRDDSGCASTSFDLAASGTAAGKVTPLSLTLDPGQSGSATLMGNSNLSDGRYSITVSAMDTDGIEPNHSANGVGTVELVVDGTAPSIPAGLVGSADRKGRVSLSWQASSDGLSGVAGYDVYRDGGLIGQTAGTSFTDSSTSAGGTYTVSARDGVGNLSQPSNSVTVGGGSVSGKGQGKQGPGKK